MKLKLKFRYFKAISSSFIRINRYGGDKLLKNECNQLFASASKFGPVFNFTTINDSIKRRQLDSPRFPMRLPKNGYRMDELQEHVDELFWYLKENRPHRCHAQHLAKDIHYATYLFNITKRYDQFVDVIHEWFRRAKPLFDDLSYFKVTSDLCNLGKLNRHTRGRLVREMGWKPVEYFLKRMMSIGFHRFHAEDIASALTGINDLFACCSWKESFSLPVYDIFETWLTHFERYLLEKRSCDPDWSALIRETATLSLWYLHQISPDLISHEKRPILTGTLFGLSKLGFDDIVKHIRDRENVYEMLQFKKTYAVVGCVFPELFDDDSVDPETFVAGLWKSWYELYEIILKYDEINFLNFSQPIQLAERFGTFRSTVFLPRFAWWYTHLEKCLSTFSHTYSRSTDKEKLKMAQNSINFIFNLGKFSVACEDEHEFIRHKHSIRRFIFRYKAIVLPRIPVDSLHEIYVSRLNRGFKELKYVCDIHDRHRTRR